MIAPIKILRPDDFHVHFRQGELLKNYIFETAKHFGRALVMPNTQPAVRDVLSLQTYKQDVKNALIACGFEQDFQPLYTFKIYKNQTRNDVLKMKEAGAIAGKLYPQGATTNAEDGVSNAEDILEVCEALAEFDMVLCIHGEDPHAFVLDREKVFLETLDDIRNKFSTLRIVLEHVTTKDAVDYVTSASSDLLSATITTHHLLFTLDELLGGFLNPHVFCKPVLKTPVDLEAIQEAVLSLNKRFFLGTDSAPHLKAQKECASSCAGVFSASVTMALITEFFYSHASRWEKDEWISNMENYCSRLGADFYKLDYNHSYIEIEQKEWVVPQEIAGVVPLCAGQTLHWFVK